MFANVDKIEGLGAILLESVDLFIKANLDWRSCWLPSVKRVEKMAPKASI